MRKGAPEALIGRRILLAGRQSPWTAEFIFSPTCQRIATLAIYDYPRGIFRGALKKVPTSHCNTPDRHRGAPCGCPLSRAGGNSRGVHEARLGANMYPPTPLSGGAAVTPGAIFITLMWPARPALGFRRDDVLSPETKRRGLLSPHKLVDLQAGVGGYKVRRAA